MSQTPITVTYSLEEILGEIKQSIKEVNQKLDRIDERVSDRLTKIEVELAEVKTEVKAINKRLDHQEFISRGVLVGLILAILGGLAKLFGLIGNP